MIAPLKNEALGTIGYWLSFGGLLGVLIGVHYGNWIAGIGGAIITLIGILLDHVSERRGREEER